MASLKPCRTCGKDVATDARKCPHCGSGRESTKEIVMGLVVVVLVIGCGFGFLAVKVLGG